MTAEIIINCLTMLKKLITNASILIPPDITVAPNYQIIPHF